MIAPIGPPPTRPRRRTPLSSARQAVAEALFDAQGRSRRDLVRRRSWIALVLMLAGAIGYLALLLWRSLDA